MVKAKNVTITPLHHVRRVPVPEERTQALSIDFEMKTTPFEQLFIFQVMLHATQAGL